MSRLLATAALDVERLWSWNVALRPLVRMRRRQSEGSDLDRTGPVTNTVLRAVVMAERVLPLGGLAGVSLMAVARKPSQS